MPLRDHFRPPFRHQPSWEELHGQWPALIVQQLRQTLPTGYVAGPRVHVGSEIEIDVAAYETASAPTFGDDSGDGGVATAVWAPPTPSVAVETALPEQDEYEVRIYDAARERRLVAAIEIVSPRNKDRPESRNAFVGKCAALMREGVAVSLVDVVTTRHANLYAELLAFLGQGDRAPAPSLYAASCRWLGRGKGRGTLQTWAHALTLENALPTLPLWLAPNLAVPLDLEASYEQACRDLWIE